MLTGSVMNKTCIWKFITSPMPRILTWITTAFTSSSHFSKAIYLLKMNNNASSSYLLNSILHENPQGPLQHFKDGCFLCRTSFCKPESMKACVIRISLSRCNKRLCCLHIRNHSFNTAGSSFYLQLASGNLTLPNGFFKSRFLFWLHCP